jgi:hypothetical protein
MAQYRKLIAAIVGLAVVVLGPSFLGLSPEGTILGIPQEQAVQSIVAVLTALGVFSMPNDPPADGAA